MYLAQNLSFLIRAQQQQIAAKTDPLRLSVFTRNHHQSIIIFNISSSIHLSSPSLNHYLDSFSFLNWCYLLRPITALQHPYVTINRHHLHPLATQLRTFTHDAMNMDSPQTHNTSLHRLQNVEKRIVRVLELGGAVMEEFSNPAGPRKDLLNNHCGEFMKLIKDIQVTLREEIKSACEYRPFEKCDYSARLSSEISCKKLEHVLSQLDKMKETVEQYQAST